MKTKNYYKQLYEIGIEASKEAHKNNMTITEFLIYGCIYFNKQVNISDIARLTEINRTTISKALKNLSNRGIVIKKESKEDRRVVYYEIKVKI